MQSDKIKKTYISLFSNAGIGCYGFKQMGFECIASNEILAERIDIQRHNSKCKYDSGYICDDIVLESTKKHIFDEIAFWKKKEHLKEVDVVIATPPCQGISVANHKKKDELRRNSLIIESLILTEKINPKIFLFENVRGFLKAKCTDTDGDLKLIRDAIENHLGNYNVLYKVVNFMDYGNPSSRTRSLVVGVRKDLSDVTPLDIFPDMETSPTLRKSIGDFKKLTHMGEFDPDDIYHNFRPYSKNMEAWVCDLKEGQSAFDQDDVGKKPHQIVNGKIVVNKNKNGDKYSRCFWDRPGFCIHTRNDIFASQKTIHPEDNRVFSIREIMTLMSVSGGFKWTQTPIEKLNALSYEDKRKFLKKHELNIRRTLGEAVPTIIFRKIAGKIIHILDNGKFTEKYVHNLIENHGLQVYEKLFAFIKLNINNYTFSELSKIAELANAERLHNAAYYTPQDICYTIINDLPDFSKKDSISILEPSVGMGNFLPLLFSKYQNKKSVQIDLIDIDRRSINLLKLLLKKLEIPSNFKINYINKDFLNGGTCFCKLYDLVIGNPPFKKVTNQKNLLASYKKDMFNTDTNNLFSFFLEKSLTIGRYVALILPKALLSAPEYNKTRELLNKHNIVKICDYGEKAFKIKIETLGLIVKTSIGQKLKNNTNIKIESYILKKIDHVAQDYVCDPAYPCWLLYRDRFFDNTAKKMTFNIFSVFRDRQITKGLLSSRGKYRVLKSRNVNSNSIVELKGYDCYIDKLENLNVSKYLNQKKIVMIPNLTYNPRGCFLPKNSITDGSVALAKPINGHKITKKDLAHYATDEFRTFYRIARNRCTRSMNIDSNAIFFFGIKKAGSQ
ncbi:MAG: DNA cytosine methyltransferase [Planctomycetes bacterium]|nr:DNA cytosine methyltransferase [Planctomycetota bacterium]